MNVLLFFSIFLALHIIAVWFGSWNKSESETIVFERDFDSDALWQALRKQRDLPELGQDVEVTYTASNGEVIKHRLESLEFKAPPDSGMRVPYTEAGTPRCWCNVTHQKMCPICGVPY